MRKRLNDTIVLQRSPGRGKDMGNTSHTVSVRPIDNGFVVTESMCDNGNYKSHETFSEERPNLTPQATEQIPRSNALSGAVKYLKG